VFATKNTIFAKIADRTVKITFCGQKRSLEDQPGVDVMITIVRDFQQFSVEKLAFFIFN
jgi:hypothetical protein